jgi:hypothetical protein
MIGGLLATGAAAAKDVKTWAGDILGLVAKIVGIVITGILLLIEKIVAYVLTLVFKVWNSAESGTDEISAAAVSGMFNTPIDKGAFAQVTNPSARAAQTATLVGVITKALGADFTGANAGPIKPSADGANKFLQLAMNMSIEGWLQGWLADAFSLHELERFGDLKDIMERSLGIGRLSHQVLRPPVKIFIRDPFTALLNGLYHPTHLPLAVALKEFTRGQITSDQLTVITDALGIPQSDVPALINDARPHVGVAQLVDLVTTGQLDETAALQELQNYGYDSNTASWAYQAQRSSRQIALASQYVQAAEAAMVARKMDVDTFNRIVDAFTLGGTGVVPDQSIIGSTSNVPPIYSPAEASLVKSIAFFKRGAGAQLVPLGTAQQMFNMGLIGGDQFATLLRLHGYTDGEATVDQWSAAVDSAIASDAATPWLTWWELLATKKEIDAQAAAAAKAASAKSRALAAQTRLANAEAKAAAAIADAEAKGVSIAKYETLVLGGLKTIAQYQAFLAEKGLAPDNVAAFTTVLQAKLDKAAAAGGATGAVVGTSKAKALSVAQLEAAVKAGFLPITEFEAELVKLGYSATDATLVGEVLQNSITAAALKAAASGSALAAAGERKVNLAQEESAVLLGIQTIAQYQAMLEAAGYDAADVAILVAELQAKLTAAQAAAKKKLSGSGLPGTKVLGLAELERMVRAGIQPIDAYQAALIDAGYTQADAGALVNLLQLVMAHDKHEAAASGKSSALLTAGGLSLAQVRTAVKLGVVPISVYDAALTAAGVSGSDALVLHASLIGALAAAGATAAIAKAAGAALAATGQTLDGLESQVLSGALSIAGFQAALTAAGVTGKDAAELAALVAEKAANGVAASGLLAGVTAAAAAKSLSLSQVTAAVKAGVLQLADYQAFVTSLGYSPADVAILVATEAAHLGITLPAA